VNLVITVRLEDEENKQFKVEELSVSARSEQSLRSMATRTLLVEAPSVITEILSDDRPWQKALPEKDEQVKPKTSRQKKAPVKK
jgi:hypothetical protein